jgi:hypothetical protein
MSKSCIKFTAYLLGYSVPPCWLIPIGPKRELSALQNMKFLHFFLQMSLTFAQLDPDLADQNLSGSMRYGSTPLIYMQQQALKQAKNL